MKFSQPFFTCSGCGELSKKTCSTQKLCDKCKWAGTPKNQFNCRRCKTVVFLEKPERKPSGYCEKCNPIIARQGYAWAIREIRKDKKRNSRYGKWLLSNLPEEENLFTNMRYVSKQEIDFIKSEISKNRIEFLKEQMKVCNFFGVGFSNNGLQEVDRIPVFARMANGVEECNWIEKEGFYRVDKTYFSDYNEKIIGFWNIGRGIPNSCMRQYKAFLNDVYGGCHIKHKQAVEKRRYLLQRKKQMQVSNENRQAKQFFNALAMAGAMK